MNILEWMSSPEVKKAFHVPDKVTQFYNQIDVRFRTGYDSGFEASAWIYDIFNKYGYKMMHVTGVTDSALSLAGTWKWIKDLKFKVTQKWTPWLTKDSELIGNIKQWENLTLVTIHGLGHNGIIEKDGEFPDLLFRYIHDEPLLV